jgi:cyclophilin family peptidyl-prolyl cis-trans isomerase
MNAVPGISRESNQLSSNRGAIGMIRSSNSVGYQFCILRENYGMPSGWQSMGAVWQGMDIVDALITDDAIIDIYLIWHVG